MASGTGETMNSGSWPAWDEFRARDAALVARRAWCDANPALIDALMSEMRANALTFGAADELDFSLAFWCDAVDRTLGDAADLIKRIERGDISLDEARPALGRELANVQTYLDLLASRAGIDLPAVALKRWLEI